MYNDSFVGSIRRGFMMLPVVLRRVILANVCVFLVLSLFNLFGLKTVSVWAVDWLALSSEMKQNFTQPWRLVTYMFVHFAGFHLLFNMLWLWWMGRPVEDTLGPRNFAVLYFGSGIGGGLVQVVLSTFMPVGPTIGASGAVFGIMVCFAVLYPRQPVMLLLFPPIEVRYLVAGLIVLDVLFLNAGDNVARLVHLGGALWGWLLIKAYYRGYNYDSWISSAAGKFQPSSSGGYRPKNKKMHVVEAEIIEEVEQDEMDRILDKISKDGYSSLSAEEKRILFELSKKK